MAKYRAVVELDRADPVYYPGEELSGVVSVNINETFSCEGLQVACRWQTAGWGIVDEGKHETQTLFSGTWKAGESYSYAFRLRVPEEPVSYDGELLSINWAVQITDGLPTIAGDVPAAPFRLSAGGRARPAPIDHSRAEAVADEPPSGSKELRLSPLVGLVLGLPLAVIGSVQLYSAVGGELFSLNDMGVGLGLSSIGLCICYLSVSNYWASLMLGKIDFAITPSRVLPGEPVTISLRVPHRAQMRIRSAQAKLLGVEEVRDKIEVTEMNSVDSMHWRTKQHEFFEQQVELTQPIEQSPAALEQVELSASITLPENAAASFCSKHNQVRWLIRVSMDLRGCPDWTETIFFEVRSN